MLLNPLKVLVKALIKQACQPLTASESKEVESYVGNVRVEKTKEEQAAAAAKAKAGEIRGHGSCSLGEWVALGNGCIGQAELVE